jgi:hypothetical protein
VGCGPLRVEAVQPVQPTRVHVCGGCQHAQCVCW